MVSRAALENLQQRLAAAGVALDVIAIADGDHVFFAPALQRQVLDTAVGWIQRAPALGPATPGPEE